MMKVKMSFEEMIGILNLEINNSRSLFLICVRDKLLQQELEIKRLKDYSTSLVLSRGGSIINGEAKE